MWNEHHEKQYRKNHSRVCKRIIILRTSTNKWIFAGLHIQCVCVSFSLYKMVYHSQNITHSSDTKQNFLQKLLFIRTCTIQIRFYCPSQNVASIESFFLYKRKSTHNDFKDHLTLATCICQHIWKLQLKQLKATVTIGPQQWYMNV